MRKKISFKTTKLYLLAILFSSTLLANSCPKWAPIAMDDIFIIIPIYPINVTAQDSDCDGVSDVAEQANGTNPNNPDTDGDGINDYRDDYPLNPNLSTDTRAPIITLNGSSTITLYKYYYYNEAGATAYDDRDGTVSVNIVGSVNTSVPATYTIAYHASDIKGNTSVKYRTVIVNPEIRAKVIVDSTAPTDTLGQRPSNVVDDFIKAFVADDNNTVSELVDANQQLLAMLYTNPDATTFLKRIYSHTYKIEGKRQASGDASVTVSFVDGGGHHKGGFELGLGTDATGINSWQIKQIY
jgi:hypothetical protein